MAQADGSQQWWARRQGQERLAGGLACSHAPLCGRCGYFPLFLVEHAGSVLRCRPQRHGSQGSDHLVEGQDKNQPKPLSGCYHWGHEPRLYAVRKGGSAHWCGDRKQSTVWDIAGLQGGLVEDDSPHSTQKPVGAWLALFATTQKPGAVSTTPS